MLRVERARHVFFARHIAKIRLAADGLGLAQLARAVEIGLIQVEEGEIGALAREGEGHGPADAATGTCDDDELLVQLHTAPDVISFFPVPARFAALEEGRQPLATFRTDA